VLVPRTGGTTKVTNRNAPTIITKLSLDLYFYVLVLFNWPNNDLMQSLTMVTCRVQKFKRG